MIFRGAHQNAETALGDCQMRQPRYSKEEHARRGTEMYNERIKGLETISKLILAVYLA